MPTLSRACLDRIGVKNSRYVETIFDFRHPGSLDPITTVVVADNGTGKTQALRVLYHVVVPVAARKMKVEAAHSDSYWEKAVLSTEAALVLLEWAPDAGASGKGLFEGTFSERFITGMIAFRRGETIRRHFFSLVSRESHQGSNFEGLFDYLTGKAIGKRPTGEEMLGLLDKLKKEPSLAVFETETQREWEEYEATRLGIDIKAFEMQVPMNLQEANAGASLIFRDEKQFVDNVIELLVPGVKGWEDPLKRIHGLADQIRRQNEEITPALEGLRRAMGPLVELGVNLNQRILSAKRLTNLSQAIAAVGSGIAARRALKDSEAQRLGLERQRCRDLILETARNREQMREKAARLAAWIGRTRIADLRSKLDQDQESLTAFRRDLRISEAVPFYRDRTDCKDRLSANQAAMEALEHGEADLLAEVRRLADGVMAGWLGVEETMKAALDQAECSLKRAEDDLKTNRTSHSEAQGQIGQLTEWIEGIGRRIQEVRDAAADLVATGLLVDGESPERALERLKASTLEQERLLAELRKRGERNDEALEDAREVVRECKLGRDQVQTRINDQAADLKAWQSAMAPIVKDDWLARLAGENFVDDETDLGQLRQVMRLLPSILERGGIQRGQLDLKHTEWRDKHRDLKQVMDRMEEHGTMPPTPDSEVLAQAIRQHVRHEGVWTGPFYLSGLRNEAQAMRALRRLPGLDSGIVVKDELLGRISPDEFGNDLILDRPVSIFTESMVRNPEGLTGAPFAVVGMGGRWWFNVEAFQAEVMVRKRDLADLSTQMGETLERLRNLTAFLTAAEGVQKRWGGKIEELVGSLAANRAKLDEFNALLPEHERTVAGLQEAKKSLAQAVREEEVKAARIPTKLAKVENHLKDANRIPGWLEERARKDDEKRMVADHQKALDAKAEEIRKESTEIRGVCEGIRGDLRDAFDQIRQIRPHARSGVSPVAMERAALERETKAFLAQVSVYEGLTEDRQPERNRLRSEFTLLQAELDKWERHLEPFFSEGITEDEIRSRHDDELAGQAEGAVPLVQWLKGEVEKLEVAMSFSSEEIARVEAVLKAEHLTGALDPDPVPRDLEEAESRQAGLRAELVNAAREGERLETLNQELSASLESLEGSIRALADGQGVINALTGKADERSRGFADGLREAEWVEVPADRASECEKGSGLGAPVDGGALSLGDAGLGEDSFALGDLRAWAGKRERDLAELEQAFKELHRKRGRQESLLRAEMDREVFGRPTYYPLRQLFLAREGENLASEMDRNLAHITKMVSGHLSALEQEGQSIQDSKKVSLNFLETVASLGLDWLSSLNALAKYPDDGFAVQPLKGKPFLKIVTNPVDQAQWMPILDEVLTAFLALGNKASGIQLAQIVVQRIARVKAVRMRHPDPDRIVTHADGMEDIRTLPENSGGERLAQVIMLYSALTRLRSVKDATSGGVLLMDNPFGALTKNVFMAQVRAVAEKHRLQLIFTCSVKDAPSISDYDHFVGLRKVKRNGPHGEYMRVEVAHIGRMEDLRSA